MTLAIRKIRSAKDWDAFFDRGGNATNLSPRVLAEFIPSSDEKDHFSIYLVEGEAEARKVAAALAMVGPGPGRTVLAAVDVTDITNAGLSFSKSPGGTRVTLVDNLHYDLSVPDYAAVVSAAKLFVSNEPIDIHAKEIRSEIQSLIKLGSYDFANVARQRKKEPFASIIDGAAELLTTDHVAISAN